MNKIIGLYLLIIFFLSGIALRYQYIISGYRISFFMILFLPFFLYFLLFLRKEKIFFPKKLTFLWLGFSIFDFISTILSLNHELSIERFLLYQSAYLIGIFFYNHKNEYKKIIEKLIIIIGIIFTIAFFLKDYLLSKPYLFDVNQLYNFYFPAFLTKNNHLGVILGIVIFLFLIRKNFLFSGLFFPIYIFSFSRSAYISLLITIILYFLNTKKKEIKKLNKKLLIINFIFFIVVFIFSVFLFVPRGDFLSSHHLYILEAIFGFRDRPFFGYGPGNFVEISRRYASRLAGTFGEVSHNLFSDILSESGIFSFIFFSFFIFQLLKNKEKNKYFYIFVYLLTNFIFSYLYSIKSVFVLFLITIGLFYKEEENISFNFLSIGYSLLIFFIAIYLFYGEILYFQDKYLASLKIYPYRLEGYNKLIASTSLKKKDKIYEYLKQYEEYFPYSSARLRYSADIFDKIGDHKRSLDSYLKLYNLGSGLDPITVREIYFQYIKLKDKKSARRFVEKFVKKIISNPSKYGHLTRGAVMLCTNIYINTGKKYDCF